MKFLFYFSSPVSVMYKKSYEIKNTNRIISQTNFYVSAKLKMEVRDYFKICARLIKLNENIRRKNQKYA
jgi:hypothetical protein